MDSGTVQWREGGQRIPWDGLRKDPELWDSQGDCVVYLYQQGTSRRPPSFQVPYQKLHEAECIPLLCGEIGTISSSCKSSPVEQSPTHSTTSDSDSSDEVAREEQLEIYLGAPKNLSREEMLQWHITTRNFFAWLVGKPLVGHSLGQALSDLLLRMQLYRLDTVDNVRDLFLFADYHGYTNMSHNPALAVAMLVFAEQHQLRNTWIDAFCHCAAMQNLIIQCPDYEHLSTTNKALINKVSLQMDVDLEAKQRAIGTLLEDDFSDSFIDLTPGARNHLDHFRSFVHSHLISTYGYWPPSEQYFSKSLYTYMVEEFDALYRLLGDFSGTKELLTPKPSSADIDTTQYLTAFDARHLQTTLATTTPLLPTARGLETRKRTSSIPFPTLVRSRSMKLQNHEHLRARVRAAYNTADTNILKSPLVQAYIEHEEEFAIILNSEISWEDARRIRWMFVYGMLQTLRSVISAPPEVSSPQTCQYPLCCRTSELPAWTRRHPRQSLSSQSASLDESPTGIIHLREPAADAPSKRMSLMSTKSVRRSLNLSRLPRITRVEPIKVPDSTVSEIPEAEVSPSTTEDSSADSDVPSLEWGRESRGSTASTHEEWRSDRRSISSASSVYSEVEVQPQKIQVDMDITDKGLARDREFIIPGLF